ncbi:MAG: hypothetical protein IK140_00340 [Clostridia bacterium]|nr:hypothetical protein [Clostridia bacterium]
MKKVAIVLVIIAALATGYFIGRSGKTPSLSASYSNGVLFYSAANIQGSASLTLSGQGDLGKSVSGTKSGAIYIVLDEGDYVLTAQNDSLSVSAEFSVANSPETQGDIFATPEPTNVPTFSPTPSPTPKATDTPEPAQTPGELVLTAEYENGVLTYTLQNVTAPLEISIDRQSARQTVTSDGTYSVETELSHGIHTVEALSARQTAKAQITAHKYEILPAVEAACTEDGLTEGIVCRVCGHALAGQQTVPALGHDVEVKAALEPTCTEDGYTKSEICRRCGEVLLKSDVLPAQGHDIQILEEKQPSCTEDGCTAGSICLRCGQVLKPQSVLPALGHEPVTDAGKEATCTEEGLTEGTHCARCGEVLSAQMAVEPLGHLPVTEELVLPTCTEKGLTQGAHCSRCGEVLKPQMEMPAAGHLWGEWITDKESDCTQEGEKHRFCQRCGEMEITPVPTLGHNGVWKITRQAKGEEGLMEQSCTRCGEALGESVLPKIEHGPNTVCTAGLKLPEIRAKVRSTDEWKMVTPVDLSMEGTYTFPVIGSATYRVGELTLTVQDGWLSAEITLNEQIETVYSLGLVFLSSTAEIDGFEDTAYSFYTLPARIRLSDLPEDRAVMLMIGKVWLNTRNHSYPYYRYDSDEYKQLTAQMREILK